MALHSVDPQTRLERFILFATNLCVVRQAVLCVTAVASVGVDEIQLSVRHVESVCRRPKEEPERRNRVSGMIGYSQ